jgi:hypothetical protein
MSNRRVADPVERGRLALAAAAIDEEHGEPEGPLASRHPSCLAHELLRVAALHFVLDGADRLVEPEPCGPTRVRGQEQNHGILRRPHPSTGKATARAGSRHGFTKYSPVVFLKIKCPKAA